MCLKEAWSSDPRVAKALGELGVEIREGAEYFVVLGRDRDILAALRTRDEVVVGISPPGIDAKLAIASLDTLAVALRGGRCEVVEVPRLVARTSRGILVAVNEIAVFPRRSATLMFYDVWINGKPLFSDAADGVLISTPLGSTAYARSAGGPIIALGTKAIEVVPVNSTSRRPAVVLPLDVEIEVSNVYSASPVEAIADGVIRAPLRGDLRVSVDRPARLMRLLPSSPRKSVEDLPPSAKFLLRVLEERGPATSSSLAAQTGLPLRTIQHALKILRERDLVEIAVEAGRRIYKLKS